MFRPRSRVRIGFAPRRLRLLGGALLGVVACLDEGLPGASSAPVDSAAGEVAFRIAGPGGSALAVPAFINGRGPFELILDTGATFTCLDTALVRQLALPERPGVFGAAVGISGTGRVKFVEVDSLRVGAASARQMTACSMDLSALHGLGTDVHGLLGLNFLRSFRVTLDFQRDVVSLTRPSATPRTASPSASAAPAPARTR